MLFLAAFGAHADEAAKRVLLVHPFGSNFSPYNDYAAKLRTDLAQQVGKPVDIYETSLATARFVEGEREGPFVDYLNSLFNGRHLDLVITIGAPAADFFHRNREHVFPETPVIYSAVAERRMRKLTLGANDASVAVELDLPVLFENILTVLPRTKHIVVVTGVSPLEKFWTGELQRELRPFEDRIRLSWLNDLSIEDMLRRIAHLPPDSAIFLSALSVDADGVPLQADRVLRDMHAVANAPIFSYVDAYFGLGIVGGPLVPQGEVSREVAALSSRILQGKASDLGKARVIGFSAPRYDWRELERWGISEAALPAGSAVLFREAAPWERYRWYIVMAGAIIVGQGISIFLLLSSQRRLKLANAERQRAEEAAHAVSGRLISAQEEERSRLARELHDDVTQRLALLAIDAGWEERSGSTPERDGRMRKMREGLIQLSEDVHALSYRLHPSILDDLGLSEAIRSECESFAHMHPVHVDSVIEELPATLPRDVSLCLFRITQEALRNIARHAGADRVEVLLRRSKGGLSLFIRDDGAGFDPAKRKPTTSLGLASMRQRVYLLGGTLEVASRPGQGTSIEAWIPLQGGDNETRQSAFG